MKATQFLLAGLTGGIFFLSGCTISDTQESNTVQKSQAPRVDLTTQTTTLSNGKEVVVYSSDTQSVKKKEATIRTHQAFKRVENSTLTIERNMTEVSDFIKNSTITIKKGATLKTPYVKHSKIIVLEGGDLQISNRMKDTSIILKKGTFSIKPIKIDDKSSITQK